MPESYSSFWSLLAVSLATFAFAGIILACIIYGDRDQIPPWRHGFVLILVWLTADTLWWDLNHPGVQYPIRQRIALSGAAAALGIFTYVRLFIRTRR